MTSPIHTAPVLARSARSSRSATAAREAMQWCLLITLGFLGLVLVRLGIPSKPMFDEVHYLPAARNLLDLSTAINREHPMLGKEILALGMWLIGDTPWGWRLPSALMGAVGLFAGMRAVWLGSRSVAATVLFGLLLATNFSWFIQSRIAMLDMAMAMSMAVALWQAVAAWANPARGRLHLIASGVFLGLSLSAKWTGAPLLMLPGLAFAWMRWKAVGKRASTLLLDRTAGPAPGVSLLEAGVWLGLLPLVVYFLTFVPYYFYAERALVKPWDVFALQAKMIALQDSVTRPHTYMSQWWQWILNLRPIWYLYENVDGAQRGVLLLGNPFTMLAALPALLICAWKGARGDGSKLAVFVLYVFAVFFWSINGKPVQFYYHYLLAAAFGMAAIALVVGDWWDKDRRWPALLVTGLALLFFVWFFPILSAGSLPAKDSYKTYTWLHSWR